MIQDWKLIYLLNQCYSDIPYIFIKSMLFLIDIIASYPLFPLFQKL